ncbi:MAG: hypothetical protein EZS28_008773 [Streblomastix strix]|uniref:HNH nuclease domain-containing protein n=1 Tax=Streblomastix strix TaxID=222440 RepID=A0A5J4WND0_9EUKA|nr:MAG: hypothetical protein EZS28_008773 [Streblomastix strix]
MENNNQQQFVQLDVEPTYEITTTLPWRIRRIADGFMPTIGQAPNGYMRTKLNGNSYGIRRLVALQFITNDDPEHQSQVDHINHIKTDNSLVNLRWEINQQIESTRQRKLLKLANEGVLLLANPTDLDEFIKVLNDAKSNYHDQNHVERNPITIAHYNNQITSVLNIYDLIDSIHTSMKKKLYKLAIDFGFVYERRDRDKNNDELITYGYIIPRESMTERRAPILIRNQQDIELYKNYIESLIISQQERTLTDTKEKYIAIYSMCAITYLLPISGKSIPSIKLHLFKKPQCLRYVNSPYLNTCVLEVIARYQLKDSKEKRYSDKQVLAKMKETGNLCYEEFDPRSFEGFNYATDIQLIHKHLNLSVNLFSYEQDDSSFRYYLTQSFPIEGDNTFGAGINANHHQ